ncbi:TetR/AcrR family transcriptional regulator [Halosimplex sp. J119]
MDDEPATEILEAAYRALCDHGYADLTMQDVAAEADTSTGLIHYYYDSKANLFSELLAHLYDRFTTELRSEPEGGPREHLAVLLDLLLADSETTPGREFRTAMLEVNAQAPSDEAIRSQLAAFDQALFERFREVLSAGVEAGAFDERVDPDAGAELLVTVVTGAHARNAAFDRAPERVHESVTRYAEAYLVADGSTEVAH